MPDSGAPNILNKSYTITAEVKIPEGGAEGMIVTDGGRFGGYGLFLSKGELGLGRGKVVFLYNLLDLKRTAWEGPELSAGKHTIVFDFKSDGPGLGKGGTGVLSVDGKEVAKNSMEHTHPDHVPGGRNLRHRQRHPHAASRCMEYRYDVPFKFTGKINKLTFNLGERQLTAAERAQVQEALSKRTMSVNPGALLPLVVKECQRFGGPHRRGRPRERSGVTGAMKKMLFLAVVSEAATGAALLMVPSAVGRLLLGEELTGVAIPVARVLGIALVALGIACWPGPPRVGMLAYGAAVAVYLAYAGFEGGFSGTLLWPAVGLHVILTSLLTWESIRDKETRPE